MQVGVKSSPDSFSAIAFILSKYRIVSSEFEEIMKLIDKEIKKTIPPIKNFRFRMANLGKILNFVKKYIL